MVTVCSSIIHIKPPSTYTPSEQIEFVNELNTIREHTENAIHIPMSVCVCVSVLLLTDILIQLAKHFLPASAYSFEHTVRQTFFSLHNISHIIERQLYIDMFGMAC